MSLEEEYRKDLEKLESSVERGFSRDSFHRFKVVLDSFLPFVVLLILFTVIFEYFFTPTAVHRVWINRLNWLLIVYFAARLGVSYRLSSNHRKFMHKHWLDILLVIPVFSILQEAKLARIAAVEEMPVFEEGVLAPLMAQGQVAGTAAKMTRISRILKRSV